MGIGALVGQRTWGGVIGIWPRHALVDGTEVTQPEYSFWFKDAGWGVENHGTEPQIEVDNAPQDDAFNAPERDRQLATATAAAGGGAAAAARLSAPHPGGCSGLAIDRREGGRRQPARSRSSRNAGRPLTSK